MSISIPWTTSLQLGWLLVGTVAVTIWFWIRDKHIAASYSARRILYRDWLGLYGAEAKPDIQKFLRCFGEAFLFPAELLHKLGPNDGVMDFYHERNKHSFADAMEAEYFVRELKDSFKYEAREEDGALTLGQLFEKATGRKRKHTRNTA